MTNPALVEITAQTPALSAPLIDRGPVVLAPSARKATAGTTNVAKFAETPFKLDETIAPTGKGEDKKILNVTGKHVTEQGADLGTADAIPTLVSSSSATKASLLPTAGAVSALASAQLQPVSFTAQPVSGADLSLLAHRAVDAVMTATERLDVGNRSTVRLQFSVGDANLSVHVELRAGEIHATFRTDSSDLRSALASEWQTMNGESGRAVRMADPVFAPAATSEHAAGFDGGAAQQRNSNGRASAENFEAAFPSSAPRAAVAEPVIADRRSAPPRANLNLYTFA